MILLTFYALLKTVCLEGKRSKAGPFGLSDVADNVALLKIQRFTRVGTTQLYFLCRIFGPCPTWYPATPAIVAAKFRRIRGDVPD